MDIVHSGRHNMAHEQSPRICLGPRTSNQRAGRRSGPHALPAWVETNPSSRQMLASAHSLSIRSRTLLLFARTKSCRPHPRNPIPFTSFPASLAAHRRWQGGTARGRSVSSNVAPPNTMVVAFAPFPSFFPLPFYPSHT
jgi:hypothetical protein